MKISVIIPVGDKMLWAECEKSILASVEHVICDADIEILPCYDLMHRGAHIARNEGLAKATGDWIAWVDCDDVVEPNWASEICAAVRAHPNVDVIQYDATEVRDSKVRSLRYRYQGEVSGEQFAHELLRNDGMPAWLWTRVFRRELLVGREFDGNNKEDYGMFLMILPRIKSVWSIGKPLYRYNRHGLGLSSYTQQMDYAIAGASFEKSIAELPPDWRHDANVGLALTMADVARHSGCENGSRQFVRKYMWQVICDWKVPFRLKVKTLLAAMSL